MSVAHPPVQPSDGSTALLQSKRVILIKKSSQLIYCVNPSQYEITAVAGGRLSIKMQPVLREVAQSCYQKLPQYLAKLSSS